MSPQFRLYRRNGAGPWLGAYYENGKRYLRSTRCLDRKAAEAVVQRWERDAASPAYARAREATLSDALELLLRRKAEDARAGKRARATVDFHVRKAGHLLRVFECSTLDFLADPGPVAVPLGVDANGEPVRQPFRLIGLTATHVDDYISVRRAEGAGENTISKELVTFRSALKVARRAGLYLEDPEVVLPIAFAPDYKPRERWLPVGEAQALLLELHKRMPDRAARIAFELATSAELGATDRARKGDIPADLRAVRVRGTKRDTRDRVVPVVLPVCRALLDYARKHAEGEGGALFLPWSNINRDLREACRRAGIEPCSSNDLRRTWATWHRAAGVPLEVLAPCMGHKDSKMLHRVYARMDPRQLEVLMRHHLAGVVPQPPEVPSSIGASQTEVCTTDLLQLPSAGKEPSDPEVAALDRNKYATDGLEMGGKLGLFALPETANHLNSMPRGGIEPPTRGFSVLVVPPSTTQKHGRTTQDRRAAATNTQQRKAAGAPRPMLKPTRRGGRRGGGR